MELKRSSGAGCISLVAALFVGLMIATAGTAIYPPIAGVGAALLCSGEVRYESRGASYRPGEYTVTRQIYCETGAGKGAESEEITFRAVGLSFLVYSAALFLILRFVAAPLMRRRLDHLLGAPGVRTFAAQASPSSLRETLDRMAAGNEADSSGAAAERLARLKALRDQGLISAEDYEAKKAEILSGL